jgi:hypothetical protein
VLFENMDRELVPIRRRAEELHQDRRQVDSALGAGAARCRELASDTMRGVRERMGFD